jgi:hypothetical protein
MRCRSRTTRAIVAAAAVAAWTDAGAAEVPPCPPSGDAVVVLTRAHELWLCATGVAPARFAVALGRGGVGKRRRGDARTPLGTYSLGSPRASERFGTFIPIGYPTPAQAARGRSGASIGIHGPPRGMDATRYPVTGMDWTLGCIATGTDADVGAIAAFVRRRQPAIELR